MMRVYLFLLAVLLCNPLLQAQASASDSRVAKLYNEAKQAQAGNDDATAIAKYESILHIAPSLGAAYNNLGALYLRQGEYRKAADILQKGLKVNPAMPSASALLGVSLFQMGDYIAARPALEAALRANPKDDNAELMLAKDLAKLEDAEHAATHLQQVAIRQPKNQEVLYLLGQVYMQLSEKAFAQLNGLDPESVYAHEISGDLMISMKNYEGALTEYKKAVAMAPEQAGTHFKLGDAYWNLADWDAAAQQFHAELTNDPHNCVAQWKLGNILLAQHLSPEEALADTEQALAACPKLTQARVDHARALILLNRNEQAVVDLTVAEKANPEEPSIHFFLSQAYRALDRTQDARAEMAAFSKLEEEARAAVTNHTKEVLKDQPAPH